MTSGAPLMLSARCQQVTTSRKHHPWPLLVGLNPHAELWRDRELDRFYCAQSKPAMDPTLLSMDCSRVRRSWKNDTCVARVMVWLWSRSCRSRKHTVWVVSTPDILPQRHSRSS